MSPHKTTTTNYGKKKVSENKHKQRQKLKRSNEKSHVTK